MAMRSSTTIKFSIEATNFLNILSMLDDIGWEFNVDGKLMFLPLDDAGMFNWREVPLSQRTEVEKLLAQKEKLGQLIGVMMTFHNTQSGGQMLYYPREGLLAFNWTIARRELSSEITDHNWYNEMLVHPLMGAGLPIENVQWQDEF